MNGLPYYKAYPRDFIEGTVGMPFEVKAAYRLVLDLIYMQGGNLPDEPRYISGQLGCSVRAWKKYRQQLLDAGKIYVNGGVISNFRADKELETLGKLQEKQRENRSRPNKNKDLKSPGCDHTEPEPEVREDTDVSSRRKPSPDEGFADFWEIWPSKKSKESARKAWRKLSLADKRAAFSAIRDGWFDRWRQGSPDASPIHAATFLNARRWEDQTETPRLRAINGGIDDQGFDRATGATEGRPHRPDPAIEQIARLAGLGQA